MTEWSFSNSGHSASFRPISLQGDDDEESMPPSSASSSDVPPPSAMRLCLLTICCVGIALNVAVFFRRHNSASSRQLRQNSSVRKSMLLLRFMAAADTVSLAALMLALCTQYLGIDNQERLLTVLCKADLFVIHSASAFSIWCWLLLSAVRYVAVYRPYAHLKLDNEPVLVAGLLAVICSVLETWILYDVSYIAELRICGETLPEYWGRRFQLIEILWTYFLPLSLITLLDVKVLCCHQTWKDRTGGAGELESSGGVQCSSGGSSSGPASSNFKLSMWSGHRASRRTEKSEEGTLLSPRPPLLSYAGTPNALRQSSGEDNYHYKTGLSLTSPPCNTAAEMESLTVEARARWTGRANEHHAGIKCASESFQNFSKTPAALHFRARRRAQQLRMLKRCLCISILDLGMNLPSYLIRLYLTVVSDEELERLNDVLAFLWLQDVSQLLYFAQFSLNALYLVGIIYVSPKKRKDPLRASILLSTTNHTMMSRVNSHKLQKDGTR